MRAKSSIGAPHCKTGVWQPLSIFYGYPAELIARWCGVSLKTAKLYKASARKPSRQALRLFAMHRDERVLDAQWDGWLVRKGCIVDPEGNVTTQAQLRAYAIVMQMAAELASRTPEDRERYHAILRRA